MRYAVGLHITPQVVLACGVALVLRDCACFGPFQTPMRGTRWKRVVVRTCRRAAVDTLADIKYPFGIRGLAGPGSIGLVADDV